MRVALAMLALLSGAMPCAAQAGPRLDVTLQPVLGSGRLTALAVTESVVADASGTTAIDLPDHYAGQQTLWTALRDLSVRGGHARLVRGSDPAHIVVRSDPGARIVLRYDVVQSLAGEPGQDEATYYRPVVQPGYFHLLGATVFAVPHGDDTRAVSFGVTGIPRGWSFASTLERKALTVLDLKLSVTVGGDFRIVRVPASDLRLAIRGRWRFGDDDFAHRVARIVDAELAFWNDPHAPYLVTVLALKSDGISASTGGTGERGGFAMYLSPQSDDLHTEYGLAHERLHGWIPLALGNLERDAAPVEAWLGEGFTDYFARRILAATKVWPQATTLAEWNRALLGYDTARLRTAPNARVAREMFTDPDMTQIPYWRGALLALMWDARLRKRGASMDDVVRRMRTLARADGRATPRENFVAAMREHGLDVQGDLARFVDAGEQIRLAPDTLAPCAAVATLSIPVLDDGFDAAATAKAGRIVTGVRRDGPAWRAGLRDGMQLIKRLSPYSIDARDQRVYSVRDRGRVRAISYRPAGAARVQVQAIVPDPHAGQSCPGMLAAAGVR